MSNPGAVGPPGGSPAPREEGVSDPSLNRELVENRLTQLESTSEAIRVTADGIRADVTTLKERSSHTATKAWVLAGVLGGMVAAAGLALTAARLF